MKRLMFLIALGALFPVALIAQSGTVAALARAGIDAGNQAWKELGAGARPEQPLIKIRPRKVHMSLSVSGVDSNCLSIEVAFFAISPPAFSVSSSEDCP
jgi:hypothetical protein